MKKNYLPKYLVIYGFLAPLLFEATDLLAGIQWQGYSFISQSISELSALGSPTRSLVVFLNFIHFSLMIAFAVGVWRMATKNAALRILAFLLVVNSLISAFTMAFYPMIQGETAILLSPHAMLMMMAVICFVLAIACGIFAFSNWFRLYSIGTLLIYLVLTLLGVFLFPRLPGASTPATGIQERVMVLGFQLWVAALAANLSQQGKANGRNK